NSSNDEIGVKEEGSMDVVIVIDVGKIMGGGTNLGSKDGMTGKGGMDIGEVVNYNEVDVKGMGVDGGPMLDVEIGWNGCFMNVSKGMNDIFENGVLVVVDVGVDVEINVGMIDVGTISKG
ncbi:hypothetical protein KI387_013756, partial [Taxus chinensis]